MLKQFWASARDKDLDTLDEMEEVERSFDPINVSLVLPRDQVLSSNGDVMATPEVMHDCCVYVLE